MPGVSGAIDWLIDVDRTTPAAVKILGISSGVTSSDDTTAAHSPPVKYCQLWYDGDTEPRTTTADYVIVPETHDRKSVFTARRKITLFRSSFLCLQCFDAVGWAAGRASGV